jgi:hypothetical protein
VKVLALEHERAGTTSADFAPHLEAEARAVWQMMQSGTIREIYFREERDQAVIVLEAADTAAARLLLAELPLVRDGLIEFEVIGLRAYPGLGRLFKS